MFDQLFYKTILSYKAQLKKRKHTQIVSMAVFYISCVQMAALAILLIIIERATRSNFLRFYEFYKPILYFFLILFILYIFNALYFNGKRMLQIKSNAIRQNIQPTAIWKLWMIPIIMIILCIILWQAT